MSNGTVSAHLRRMRKQYRHSRDRIARILIEEAAGVLTPIVPEQGLHMIVRLASNLASGAGRKIRAEAGVEALLLSETQTVTTGIEAFVLGFSGFAPEVLSEAASSLARAARKLVE
jgi:GntR family transcriptional regulator/MocR family aminotransferase